MYAHFLFMFSDMLPNAASPILYVSYQSEIDLFLFMNSLLAVLFIILE